MTRCPAAAALAALLAAGPAAARAPGGRVTPDALTLRRPDGPQWFGLYLAGRKAGWTRAEVRAEGADGAARLRVTSETLLRVRVGGAAVDRHLREERLYEALPAGRLLAFHAEWSGDGGARSLDGACDAAACAGTLTEGGTARPVALGPAVETLEQAEGVRLAAARRGHLRGEQLDLEQLRPAPVERRFVRRERLVRGGVALEVSVVREGGAGEREPGEYRVADDGRIAEIRIGAAIVARPEPEAEARRLAAVDLFGLARVALPSAPPQGVPATVVYRVAGLPPGFLEQDGRQSTAPGPRGTTLVTVKARRPAAADPLRDTPRAEPSPSPEWVEATQEVDADRPELRALARRIAGDAPGRYAAALRLSEEVHRRLAKAYGASHEQASAVLAAGRGDCTEHALLLVALARALGIPARQVHGLVRLRDAAGDALGWHAWAEVYSAGEWIALDPTLGQPVADAGHLALGRGRDVAASGLVGVLRVEGLEVR